MNTLVSVLCGYVYMHTHTHTQRDSHMMHSVIMHMERSEDNL